VANSGSSDTSPPPHIKTAIRRKRLSSRRFLHNRVTPRFGKHIAFTHTGYSRSFSIKTSAWLGLNIQGEVMKLNLIMFAAVLAFASAGAVGSAQAQAYDEVETATVPFAFYAGKQEMPAGNYRIGVDLETRLIRLSNDSGQAMFLTGIPAGEGEDLSELVFTHSGDTYALKEVKSEEIDLTFNTRVPAFANESRVEFPEVVVALNR
jgi:hypothetical protein